MAQEQAENLRLPCDYTWLFVYGPSVINSQIKNSS